MVDNVYSPVNQEAQRLRPPQRASLVDLAYEAIVEAIVDRQLLPDTRLNMDSLASQLEMSNTPIREALARATAQGLVQQVSNRGFRVAPLLSKKQYHDLFEVRHLLEIHGLRHATPDVETLDGLAKIATELQQLGYGSTYKAFKDLLDADRQFHETILRVSNNDFLIQSWTNLHFYLHASRLHTRAGAFVGEDFHASIREHMEIVECLRAGKQDKAVDVLSQHIHSSQKRLLQLLEE